MLFVIPFFINNTALANIAGVVLEGVTPEGAALSHTHSHEVGHNIDAIDAVTPGAAGGGGGTPDVSKPAELE